MGSKGLETARAKMQDAGVDPVAIDTFAHYYRLLEHGETGMIPESSIEPLDMRSLADVEVSDEVAAEAIRRTVVIKLNGGLGTSMGMDRAKSLLCVRRGLSFLDIIARQVLHLRKEYDAPLPLIFMNSFRTSADTMAALARYEDLQVEGLPLEFLQNKVPKLLSKGLVPASYPKNPDLEWCPPGHGDLYTALRGTGLLGQLREAGYKHVFVSNSDNLGAVPDARVAGWFAQSGAPFAIEAVRRTASDRKGGHFATRKADGRIVLRETAQTLEADKASLADLDRHRFSSTNNLWFDLEAMTEALDARQGILGLPMIRNVKHLDPADPPPRGGPDRDRDGSRHRDLRGRAHHRGGPRPVRAGQDDQRPAGAALRHLRPRQGLRARPGVGRACRSSSSTATSTSSSATSTSASPKAPRRCARRRRWSSTVTSPSVAACESWATSRSRRRAPSASRPPCWLPMAELLPVPDLVERILASVSPLPDFPQPLMEALGLALAEDVTATISLPGFDNSGMDGYAVTYADVATASEDTPVHLPVVGEIGAGRGGLMALSPGTAAKIMTGAPVPAGCDAIVPYEWTDRGVAQVRITRRPSKHQHIRFAGEDVAEGDQLLEHGTVLGPRHLGLLAAVGRATVRCRPRPASW